MKLLIIDDEKITREGIMNSVNWKSLHIQEVLQADDGVKGLSLAKMHRPEIILSDIRMPRKMCIRDRYRTMRTFSFCFHFPYRRGRRAIRETGRYPVHFSLVS